MDVVLILCYNRPEYLEVCLKKIMESVGFEKYCYVFQVDRNNRENDWLISRFSNYVECRFFKSPEHGYQGNCYNATIGYANAHRVGVEVGAKYGHMIEDDVIVSPDYFNFHERIWALNKDNDFGFVCGTQNQRVTSAIYDPAMVYRSYYLQTLGISFPIYRFKEFGKYHKLAYLLNPIVFLQMMFPTSKIDPKYAEQAGLVRRIMEQEVGIYPTWPRAYHAGVYGQNQTAKTHKLNPVEIEKMTGEQMTELSNRGFVFTTDVFDSIHEEGFKFLKTVIE